MVENQENIEAEKSPFDLLRESTPGFPSNERIAAWKVQVPGNRIKMFCPDGKRVYFLRGLSGIEFATVNKQVAASNFENPELEVALIASAKCTLWTNTSANGTLDEAVLRSGAAGLPSALFDVVQNLSDFYSPQQLFHFSMEL
jgi:hypothetical protein